MNQKFYLRGLAISTVLLSILLTPFSALAQGFRVEGTVVDGAGEPIVGASVMEQGTSNMRITDTDGSFTLTVDPSAILSVSYLGYATQEVPVNNRAVIRIQLAEDAMMLDELIVVGYGTMRKSDMTGAISSVDIDELTKRATTNPAEALQGQVAGVNILKTGGNAGAGVQVKIRGVKTFGNNQPLYIIDGFPGDIVNINPQDIASMEVLKDGAAAAIYGSVAANGVIIVTTKNGKKGETKVDFSSYFSFTSVAKKLEILDATEYRQVHKQMFDNANMYKPANDQIAVPVYVNKDSNVNSNWQDAMMRGGFSQNYMASVRGGSDNAQYSISYNHSDEKGIFLGNDFRQENARAKLRMSKYIFDFDANLAFRFTDSKQPQYSLKEIYMISPLVPIYDESQPYGFGISGFDGLPTNRNVMADHHYRSRTDKRYSTVGNFALTMNFTPWLSFKTSYNYRGEHQRQTYHTPIYQADNKSSNDYPYYKEEDGYWQEQVVDNVLNFTKKFGKHDINAMLGSSITAQTYTWNGVDVSGNVSKPFVNDSGKLDYETVPGGFIDDNFQTIDAGDGGTFSGWGSNWKYNRASFFGRVNYNFDNRYLLQVTFRRDGSSKFGQDSRWGDFPSVALGWRISEEAFFPKSDALSYLKLRASWGRLGNENTLGYYDFLASISTSNTMSQGYVQGNGQNPWPGSIARGLENRSLKWETTDTKNIGLDFAMFNHRLTGALNYYYNSTEDMLITKELPASAGLDNPVLNVGKIRNSGIEIELNWADRAGDFEYGVGMNLTTTSNKLLALADKDQVLTGLGLKFGTEHKPTTSVIGKPIGAFFLYKTDGIFQSDAEAAAYTNSKGERLLPAAQAGDIRFVDVDGNGVIDDDDKVYCGSAIPKMEVNLNVSLAYKGFDFYMLLGSGWGNKLYNGNKYFYEGMASASNFLRSSLDAWTPQNTNTNIPRAVYEDPNNNTRESDRFLESGNFIRLRQVQLGYTLPSNLTKKIRIEKLRIYVSGDNLLTWTKYSGVDPEFFTDDPDLGITHADVLSAGIDNLIFPFTRSFTAGLQFTF